MDSGAPRVLDAYIEACASPEDDYLSRLYRATNLSLLRPRMASGHVQGLFLRMVARMARPQRVLEIGTYSGYSALALASGMEKGTELDTFEINDELEDFTRPWLEGSPYAARINFFIGDALQLVPRQGRTYDLAFIDADKRHYLDYYELALSHVRPGGFILADNTLWDGHVVDTHYDRDPQTVALRRFNAFAAADERTETILLPLRDGLTLLRKK